MSANTVEFGSNSNLGSLVAAVLVGILALGANYYMRLNPQTVVDMGERVKTSFDTKFVSQEIPEITVTPIADLELAIQESSTRFKKMLRGLKSGKFQQAQFKPERMQQELNQVRDTYSQLRQHPDASSASVKKAGVWVLQIFFAASKIFPSEYSTGFIAMCDQYIENDPDSIGTTAALLQFHYRYDLRRQSAEEIVAGYRSFIDQHTAASNFGIRFCSLLAKDVWKKGRDKLSQQILQTGLDAYSHNPASGGLTRQLAHQKTAVRRHK